MYHHFHKSFFRMISTLCLIVLVAFLPLSQVHAGTVYFSDLVDHEEGYIIIGESHIVLTSDAYSRAVDENYMVKGLNDVHYQFMIDGSRYLDDNGNNNTFNMQGNLFFVFEGNASKDAETQKSNNYIFSDGHGNYGVGVRKIHEIIDSNPNIKHWNIISYHGAVAALGGAEAAGYYIDSYKNWMSYEFPTASIYFVSHSTMTKFYKQNRSSYLFDEEIKKAFPSQYFDMTQFYKIRYPQQMYDPKMNPDTIHWSHATYVELFNYVIGQIHSEAYTAKCRLLRERIFYQDSKYQLIKNTVF